MTFVVLIFLATSNQILLKKLFPIISENIYFELFCLICIKKKTFSINKLIIKDNI